MCFHSVEELEEVGFKLTKEMRKLGKKNRTKLHLHQLLLRKSFVFIWCFFLDANLAQYILRSICLLSERHMSRQSFLCLSFCHVYVSIHQTENNIL